MLLWLLNSVTQEQLEGISNYFAPASAAPTTSGAGGVLGGQTVAAPGAEVSARAKPTVSLALPPPKTGLGGDDLEQGKTEEEKKKEEEAADFRSHRCGPVRCRLQSDQLGAVGQPRQRSQALFAGAGSRTGPIVAYRRQGRYRPAGHGRPPRRAQPADQHRTAARHR